MIFHFFATIEPQGKRSFIKIPLNLWQETGLKGNIPCKVSIDSITFECKLIPKGNGNYLIPLTKQVLSQLKLAEQYEIELEIIETLTRINHDSPYSLEHPIRKIDHIEDIPAQKGLCGHGCVAMLAQVEISEVVSLMGKAQASWSKILEALDYYGISHANKAVYPKDEFHQLPACCILYNDGGFVLWYQNAYYGTKNVDPKKTVSYIEVFTD
ncbi:MAG: DUF1905 domain-containing protein [Erysipelotrichaceae bacterium]